MVSYTGRHALLYDLFYANKPYKQEAAFVHECLVTLSSRPVKRLLELACGTGSHALELERYGYEIVAVDYSADMLRRAREKSSAANSKVDFRLGDMRKLTPPDCPFDAAISLFDSIGYVKENEAVLDVLRGVRNQLDPGGLFIFEFWHAAAMLRRYEPVRVRRFCLEDKEIVRISETRIDSKKQLAEVSYTIYELGKDGTYSALKEVQVNRFFLVEEMGALLKQADFEPVKWFAGFVPDEHINEDTWHVVAVARAGT